VISTNATVLAANVKSRKEVEGRSYKCDSQ